jgi:hypothetical protein
MEPFDWLCSWLKSYHCATKEIVLNKSRGRHQKIRLFAGVSIQFSLHLAVILVCGAVALFLTGQPIELTSCHSPLATVSLSGFLVLTFEFIFQSKKACFGGRLLELLDRRANPDQPIHTPRVTLQPAKYWRHIQLRSLPRNLKELLLIAPQSGHQDLVYSIDTLIKQIQRIQTRLAKRNSQAKLKWICYTTKNGDFVAYQKFPEFWGDINESGLNQIVSILNITDATAFRNSLHHWSQQRTKKTSVFHAVGGVSFGQIPEGVSNRGALCALFDAEADNAMIVSKDQKPVGVATVGGVAKTVLLGLLGCSNSECKTETVTSAPDAHDDFSEDFDDLARQHSLALDAGQKPVA